MKSLLDLSNLSTESCEYEEASQLHPSVENVPTEVKETINTDLSENRENAESVKTLLDVVESLENFKDHVLDMKESGITLTHETLNVFNQRIALAFKQGKLEEPLPIYLAQESFSDIFGRDKGYLEIIKRIEAINTKLMEKLN